MKIRTLPPFLLLFFVCSAYVIQAQFIDSVKSKSKKTIQTVSNLFKQKNKDNSNNNQEVDKSESKTSFPAFAFEKRTISFTSGNLKSLEVPVYKNIPIVAFLLPSNPFYGSFTYEQKQAFEKTLENYRLLLEVNVLESIYKTRGSPFTVYNSTADQPSIYVNGNLRKLLRYVLFDDKLVEKYFCQSGGSPKQCGDMWGGGVDEFRKKKTYEDFLRSGIFETVQKTANELPAEIYFLFSYKLPDYDFDKKGFPLNFYFPRNEWHSFSSIGPVKSGQKNDLLLEMSADDAQILRKKIRNPSMQSNHPENDQVYILYRVEFLKDKLALNEKNYQNTMLIGKLKTETIELFEDPFLKRKIKDVSFPSAGKIKTVVAQQTPENTLLAQMPVRFGNNGLADFNIISYRGLPLLGELENIEKMIKLPGDKSYSYRAYYSLLKYWKGQSLMKFRKSPFLKYDPASSWTEEMSKSQMANNLLVNTLGWVVSEELYNQFFCNATMCSGIQQGRYETVKGKSTWGHEIIWGGSSKDEFEEREAYSRFEKSGIDKYIGTTAGKIPKTAYVVADAKIHDYDFEKEGFLVTLPSSGSLNMMQAGLLSKSKDQELFYKIPPDKAKEFKSTVLAGQHPKRMSVTILYKIRFLDQVPQTHEDISYSPYEIIEGEFEMYENNTLEKKITTLSTKK
jgi:hypothetical protein